MYHQVTNLEVLPATYRTGKFSPISTQDMCTGTKNPAVCTPPTRRYIAQPRGMDASPGPRYNYALSHAVASTLLQEEWAGDNRVGALFTPGQHRSKVDYILPSRHGEFDEW